MPDVTNITPTAAADAADAAPILRPPTDAESAVTGWKVQRARMIREGAETAAAELAAREDRIIRPSDRRTVTVELPADFSQSEGRDGVEGFHAETPVYRERRDPETGDRRTVGLTFRQRVTVPVTWTVDPRQRWQPAALLAAARRAAGRERLTIRPRPSREAAEDAAADIIVRIIGRERSEDADRETGATYGGMPRRDRITDTYLRQSVRGIMLNAARLQEDADGIPEDADLPELSTIDGTDLGETLAAGGGKWRDGLTDPTADPTAPEWTDAYDRAELSDRERAAATGAIVKIGPAAMAAAGMAARETLKRGRRDLKRRDPETIRAAFRAARRAASETDPTAELAAVIESGPTGCHRPSPEPVSAEYLAARTRITYRGLSAADSAAAAAARWDRRETRRHLLAAATAADDSAAGYRLTVTGSYRPDPDYRPLIGHAPIQSGPVPITPTAGRITGPTIGAARSILPMPDRLPARDPENPGPMEVAHADWTVRTDDGDDVTCELCSATARPGRILDHGSRCPTRTADAD